MQLLEISNLFCKSNSPFLNVTHVLRLSAFICRCAWKRADKWQAYHLFCTAANDMAGSSNRLAGNAIYSELPFSDTIYFFRYGRRYYASVFYTEPQRWMGPVLIVMSRSSQSLHRPTNGTRLAVCLTRRSCATLPRNCLSQPLDRTASVLTASILSYCP